MPTNRHLNVIEITDFSPGLWENADWLMPASAAQEMTDCYPQLGGGLRAFFKGTDISTTGIQNPTEERIIGLYARGSIDIRAGVGLGQGVDWYLMTYRYAAGATRPKLYRMDGTNGETTWTRIYVGSGTTELDLADSDNNAPQKAVFRFFKLLTGAPNDDYVIVSIEYLSSPPGGTGFYRLNYNDLSSSQKLVELTTSVAGGTYQNGALAVHQGRVIIAGLSAKEGIIWSDAGTVTFAAPNYLRIEPSQDMSAIIAMHPLPPSDLLILKEGAPMVTVQGDVTDPVVQGMVEGVAAGSSGKQDFGRTPNGLTFISTGGQIYETNGSTVNSISEQLGAFGDQPDFVGPGDTNYLNDFLFAPNGYVKYLPTNSWFKQTRLAGALHNVERSTRIIWGGVATGTSFALRKISPFPGNDRMNTYAWKTPKLRSPDGRQLVIREVEVVAKSYDASATVSVTVGGTTIAKTLGSAGVQDTSALFNVRGETLDVRIVPSAASGSVEAPSIEAVRIYTQSGHQTY